MHPYKWGCRRDKSFFAMASQIDGVRWKMVWLNSDGLFSGTKEGVREIIYLW